MAGDRLRVLLLGAQGLFGRHLAQRLSRLGHLELIIASRSAERAGHQCAELAVDARSGLEATVLDTQSEGFAVALRALAPHVVVNMAGPYASSDLRVPLACIAARAHSIDLADRRDFMAQVNSLDAAARAAGVLITSGASSVPALSSAVADYLTRDMVRVDSIDVGISPGNRSGRGLATVRSVLSLCGRPIEHADGGREVVWGSLRRHRYPAPVGERWLSPMDVPDLDLLPWRYAGQPRVRFRAGLELGWMHGALVGMALLRRLLGGPDWSRLARPLNRIASRFDGLGTDAGAMHVIVTGCTGKGMVVRRPWHLVATSGHGPHVPTLAVSALLRRLHEGTFPPAGAMPCVGLLDLAEFRREAQGLSITMRECDSVENQDP